MKINSKMKLFLNIVLLVVILGVMFYLLQNSFGEILAELKSTTVYALITVFACGTLYLIAEGINIKTLAEPFTSDFTRRDGFFAVCYYTFYRVVTFGAGTLISEVNYYRRKGLRVSDGVGVTALHMVMYKLALLVYALIGLLIQFSLFYDKAPNMIPLILAGMIVTFLIIAALLLLSLSLKLQVFFVKITNKLFKSQKLREMVDQANLQIYSLRLAVNGILQERPRIFKIFLLNLLKMAIWYVLPYFLLVENHPSLDFLLTFSLISFTVILAGVIPTPAGIGSFEFVYLLLFKPLVGTVDAVSSMLLYRFATYIWPFALGFVYVLWDKRKAIKGELKELNQSSEKTN